MLYGANEEQMKPILKLIRQAQWRWDYVAASIGGSFHAPLESARILGLSIQKGEEARNELVKLLMKLNTKFPIPMPDISTKEKAQKFIGLDMKKLHTDKEQFLNTVVTEWDKKAEQNKSLK